MSAALLILLANALATWFMTGLIWIVQIVHYPLFAIVGLEHGTDYQRSHQFRISFVVAPPMLIEAATSLALAWYVPVGVAGWQVITGIGLVLVIWLSTALFQVPCHGRLASLGFDDRVHRRLVRSNWIRTIAWSLRAALVAVMLAATLAARTGP